MRFDRGNEIHMSTPTISIIIPIYNEKHTITKLLDRVHEATARLSVEIILVDDASTDGTAQVLSTLISKNVQVYTHDRNQGKGAAIRTGIAHVTGEIIIIQDADLEYHPRDYPTLLEPILEGEADVVFGNRFHGRTHRVLYVWHYLGNKALTYMTNIFTGLNLSDMEVGFKVFRTEVLKQITLKSNRFGFEPEIVCKIAKLRCRIYEVPVRYYGRTYEEGKKITWRDGVAAFVHIIRFRFFD